MIRAAVMPAPGKPVEVWEFAKPSLEDGAVLLRTVYSEVCGTDLYLQEGRLRETPFPLIPGHATVGVVEEVRGNVTDIFGRSFEGGERVTYFDVHGTCGACWHCLVARATTRCPKRKVYGITLGANEGLFGGWSEYVYLKPGTKIVRLPEKVSFETMIGGGCGLPTAFHAVERSDILMGETVLVQGSGPVGLSAVSFARSRGAYCVIVVGAPQLRLDAAQRMAADICLDVTRTTSAERLAAIMDATQGRGVDTCIEASGNPAAIAEGLDLVRDNGKYTIAGQYTDHGPVSINPHLQVNKKHLDIRGVWGIDFSHLHRAILMQEKYNAVFHWDQLITHRFGLGQANEAMDSVRCGKAIKAVIQPSL
jgi:threonine dehydrogenase-like Zn-dependent dehydrogenase